MNKQERYKKFLKSKYVQTFDSDISVDENDLNDKLYDWQRRIVKWSLERGRAALFEDCGCGKTPQQLEWARHIAGHTSKNVLIFAPLAVGRQTEEEGRKFGIAAKYVSEPTEIVDDCNIFVTNYERLEKFTDEQFGGIVLDESSILKSLDGKTRTRLIEFSKDIDYRLCCTATPAPNDFMELGNHAEFLGVCAMREMLSTYFVHDGGETQKWRLKGHAVKDFWKWMCQWAVAIRKPSDIGGSDDGFILPKLNTHHIVVGGKRHGLGMVPWKASTLSERRDARRESVKERARKAADLCDGSDEPWLFWCDLNVESDQLAKQIDGAVEIRGSQKTSVKEKNIVDFIHGKIKRLVSKPSICGFGLNLQHCSKVVFVGLSDSYESFYQAVRRCWRYGQQNEVDCYIISSENEGSVIANIERKTKQAEQMMEGIVNAMKEQHELAPNKPVKIKRTKKITGNSWVMFRGDCVSILQKAREDSIDYTIFSPPFASLYTYTDDIRDMGNTKDDNQFIEHFLFLIDELFRVTKPGRLCSFHCINIPTMKQHGEEIGLRDFRGELTYAFMKRGWIYHSEVCIWKDPVTQMQRTKALGLLHKQLKKDSTMSRQGLADYVVTMRKPGENNDAVSHTNESFPVDRWQKWASPIWTDINPSDTLQYRSAREDKDEKHIAPLQLEVVRRCLTLWSNKNDVVLSPFAGIGTEGYEAIKAGRKFVGIELKQSYFKQAIANLKSAVLEPKSLMS